MSGKFARSGLLSQEQQKGIRKSISNVFIQNTKSIVDAVTKSKNDRRNMCKMIDVNSNYRIKFSEETVRKMQEENLHFMNDAGPGMFRGALVDAKNNIKGRAILTIEKINPESAMVKQDDMLTDRQINRRLGQVQGQLVQVQMQNLAIMKKLMQISKGLIL